MISDSQSNKTQGGYGFYGRLKATFPSQVIVDATEICNLACIHCPHPEFKKSEHYHGQSLQPDLNAKMVKEVREHGKNLTQYIRYTSNGEPLLHKHIYEMLAHAAKDSGTLVTLTTNGTILNEQRIDKVLETGVHLIDISIDAFTPDTYAKIRVNGNLEVTRGNVLNLIGEVQKQKKSTKVVVSYVEQPLNVGETSDFEKFWKDHGASYVVVRRLHSAAGSVSPIAQKLRDPSLEKRTPCLYPWERILLNPRGELAFCPQDWVHGSVIADYRDHTIQEVWQGEFYQKLREAHLTNCYKGHQFCGQCPDWKGTRWPDEGRSYADMVEEFKPDFATNQS